MTKQFVLFNLKEEHSLLLDKLNKISEDKVLLKKAYKSILRRERLNDERGIELWLVSILRSSRNKILYNFKLHDKDYYLFTMIVCLDIISEKL